MSINKLLQDETGGVAIEYALVAALIAMGILAALITMGGQITSSFSSVASKVAASTPDA